MPVNSISFNSFLFLLGMAFCAAIRAEPDLPELTPQQLQWLGDRVFANECNSQRSCLLSWNQGEEFPSLGIGHFIWYPAGYDGPFTETFPSLVKAFHEAGVELPGWLQVNQAAPWRSREEFLAERESPASTELETLLAEHRSIQAEFIAQQFTRSLPNIFEAAIEQHIDHTRIATLLQEIAWFEPPLGLFALIDYVHFKGSGTNPRERYQKQGWGLVQVLGNMDGHGKSVLDDFIEAARTTLSQRVANAPPSRNEQRWLQGWHNRVNSYRGDPH